MDGSWDIVAERPDSPRGVARWMWQSMRPGTMYLPERSRVMGWSDGVFGEGEVVDSLLVTGVRTVASVLEDVIEVMRPFERWIVWSPCAEPSTGSMIVAWVKM